MSKAEKALIWPFAAFIALFALELVQGSAVQYKGGWDVRSLIYPLQVLVCGWLLRRYWVSYPMGGQLQLRLALGTAILVVTLWLVLSAFLGPGGWQTGFNAVLFREHPWWYGMNFAVCFLRLAIIVPLVEELFWRGFLLRYLIGSPATAVPFGSFSWLSFSVVSMGFMLEHKFIDYPPALLTGMLYNWLAYRGKSLKTCIAAHIIANSLLGLYAACS